MGFAFREGYSIKKNESSIDIDKLKRGDCEAQFFAMFLPSVKSYENAVAKIENDWDYVRVLSEGFFNDLKDNDDIAFAGSISDIDRNMKEGKMSALLTIEDGRLIEGKMENLKKVYDMGVRLISLTWNYENCFGYPNSADEDIMKKGLKEFGIEAIQEMNRLGIIVDVSHLSDGGFYDVAKYSTKPFVASHSDCRSLTAHQRNLTDDMIRILADKGGVSGINFCYDFIYTKPNDEKLATVDHMIDHIKHFEKIGGIDCVGLGSDFDGIGNPVEIKNASMMDLLYVGLSKEGYSDDKIEKIFSTNVRRVIRECL